MGSLSVKLEHPTALVLVIEAGKVCSYKTYPMLLEYYNRTVT